MANVRTVLKGMYFSAAIDAWSALGFVNMDLTQFQTWNTQENRPFKSRRLFPDKVL